MTGYGRSRQVLDGREITVEIRSVNHRYLEYSARIPRMYGYLEEKLKTFLQSSVSRGKVEVTVSIQNLTGGDTVVQINQALAKGYLDAMRSQAETLGLQDDLTLSTLTRFNDVFTLQKLEEDQQVIWNGVEQVAKQALDQFLEMRRREGDRLKQDITQKLAVLAEHVAAVEEQSPKTVAAYRQRLLQKMEELLADRCIDQQRILMEAGLYAEKIAVDEETVRLKSHLDQFAQMMEQAGPVGRKLDFLVQEINRETNTIGSKAQDLAVTRRVVEMKSEIEKIREQIQNIE
ncbi:MAG TPA: YicC family protein [Candidatus Egerieicola pullicola]|uniref:YicC family protein n=1 Tax=Candidatus Egerieicola pullicola TaxID=2840775 RepID=A0A9D1AK23_9FIRM|nr:YicC family protein [Candidatus Egerieicola pullicola]